jgi:hypothetical protein
MKNITKVFTYFIVLAGLISSESATGKYSLFGDINLTSAGWKFPVNSENKCGKYACHLYTYTNRMDYPGQCADTGNGDYDKMCKFLQIAWGKKARVTPRHPDGRPYDTERTNPGWDYNNSSSDQKRVITQIRGVLNYLFDFRYYDSSAWELAGLNSDIGRPASTPEFQYANKYNEAYNHGGLNSRWCFMNDFYLASKPHSGGITAMKWGGINDMRTRIGWVYNALTKMARDAGLNMQDL